MNETTMRERTAGFTKRELEDYPLLAFGLTMRIANCLKNEGVTTLEGAAALGRWRLRYLPNFGRLSLALLARVLAKHGLHFADEEARKTCPHCGHIIKGPEE